MINLVLLLVTTVCCVFGAPGITKGEPPTPCCTAEQWEGVMVELGGYASGAHAGLFEGPITVSYDHPGMRVATVAHLNYSAGIKVDMKTIQDFKAGMSYVIQNNNCTKAPLAAPISPNCIPDSAVFGGGFYFGGPDHQLPSSRWTYVASGMTTELWVTQQDCIPVLETLYSTTDNGGQITTIAFASVTAGIKDPSVFTPPAICNKVSHKHPHHQLKGLHRYAVDRLRR